ncbi:T9SS type A sorting domain-containing protein [Dyadobacter sp. CY261]|uniref:T9SS type A sorting domain-containing protein n=1 Tax=Dyadobacter sp. CY261 TaxID=2907203 RepID=UPI001F292AD9|nr:T9SS type A sorting domain-containing protein [Dyadobacter sp. CY261]MCF0071881.1 T9SS type A sorting domain-containing protein [Dyadobacter sp. CY261]
MDRLKLVDLDGSFAFSKIVHLTNRNPSKMEAYPNPADRFITIEVPDNDFGFAKVEVINKAGVKVLDNEKMPLTGNKVFVNISGIPAGLYQVVITTPGSVQSHPILKVP